MTIMPLPFAVSEDPFASSYSDYLRANYFTGFEQAYLNSDQFKHDVAEHVHRRTTRFHDHLVPWIGRVFDLKGATALEIGSGTGSSTLAFSPYVEKLHCYEIDEKSTRAAKERMRLFNVSNVSFEGELFGPQCRFIQDGKVADVVLFVAVIEHMTFEEMSTCLRAAYACLRPGGIIVVAETPNRLTVTDYHSSWINFYQWLPPEIRERYYDRSPRQHFAHDIGAVRAKNPFHTAERLTRWGNGVSYHDFELALGNDVHNCVVADGWEDEVRPLAPVFKDDEVLTDIFTKWDIKANKAFARSWLYFILKKPG
jgi:ubiquinone/menaquinone biosynthesis C-methylase UbiE